MKKKTGILKLQDEIKGINDSLEKNMDRVNTMESELIEGQKKLYGFDLEKENREDQIRILKEQIGEVESGLAATKSKEASLQDKLQALIREKKDKKKGLQDFQDQLQEVERNIQEFERNIKTSEIRIDENSNTIRHEEKSISDGTQNREELQDDLRKLTDDIVYQLDTRLKESGYSHEEQKKLEKKSFRTL